MEEELDAVVGPKRRHLPKRKVHRHGHEAGSVTLEDDACPVSRPRARSGDMQEEVALAT